MYRGATDSGIKIPTNGLLINYDAAQLRSYPGSGNIITDLSGVGNNGTLTNGPTFSSLRGGSILVDGVDDYISLGTWNSGVNINLSYLTFIVWLRQSYQLGSCGILSGCINNPPTGLYGAYILFNNGGGTQTLQVGATASGGSSYNLLSTTNIPWDTDTMVAFTFDPASTGTANIYINGVLDKSGFFFTGSIININGQQYRIATGTTGTPFFKGYIYSAQVYSVALTATQIKQYYDATKTRFGLS
jgi:Concanavalin A-like lectin/glucanases superfamily